MKPIIQIHNLSKHYSDKTVLHSLNLDILPGQVVGYLGPNGAGKSTTVKVITGLISEFSGTVNVCGFDVRESPEEVKKRIGYVPETAELYETLTPAEYLRFVGQLYHLNHQVIARRSEDLLVSLGLKDDMHRTMGGFSKGMKQKVLISAALIHNPEVIVMDEPMSGLDANAVMLMKDVISQLAANGKTVFYCSHLMDVVERVCDRIIILSKGAVIADGSFAELQQMKEAEKAAIRKEKRQEQEEVQTPVTIETLEQIFSDLTSEISSHSQANALVSRLICKDDTANQGGVVAGAKVK